MSDFLGDDAGIAALVGRRGPHHRGLSEPLPGVPRDLVERIRALALGRRPMIDQVVLVLERGCDVLEGKPRAWGRQGAAVSACISRAEAQAWGKLGAQRRKAKQAEREAAREQEALERILPHD